eukprot:TRINITY_DN111483_c0_g1_i1.p1 TRINITY_DN111483_c0_g1~~TRINITY_DN111483_c0_g1_i1.p1  ORF type:complete len:193 (-),score=7.03 TRINITY_DN111483_c0_g1_i1:70-591(-)
MGQGEMAAQRRPPGRASSSGRCGGCCCCFTPIVNMFKVLAHCECFPVTGRSMMPTIHGGKECCGSDIIIGMRPSRFLPLRPRVGEVVVLVDRVGRMVKRLTSIAIEDGFPERAWCWVEGDNLKLSEDSRLFGWTPSHRIEAVAIMIIWPPWRARWLIEKGRVCESLAASQACI